MSVSAADALIVVAYMAGVVVFGMWVGRGARPSETVRNLMKKKPAPAAEA